MLHSLDILANVKIQQEPSIIKYWIEGKISTCKEKNIKIIINNNNKKKN